MKNTGQKLILISFVLALLAAITVFIYLKSLKISKKAVSNTTIVVAAETIPARTLIDKSMLTTIEVTDNPIFNDYIKDSSQIIGKHTKETVIKNEGFLKEKLIYQQDEELSLKVDKTHRAVTINATGDSGVARLIKPGDFVDVVAYLPEKTNGATIIRPDITKLMLQNIEVIALDEQLTREENKTDEEEPQKESTIFLVTLSVKPVDLEKLSLAENIGNLKLALRPIKATDTIETKGTTWEDIVVWPKGDKESDTADEDSSKSSSEKEKYRSYAVKRGDTLQKISKAFYGTPDHYELIKEVNHIKDEDIIVTGEMIKIPILEE
ncbi:MAG: putative cell wall binding protein [Clostridia bacterium]|nr:putative cell wall binding protein [Clostridia bacterium]